MQPAASPTKVDQQRAQSLRRLREHDSRRGGGGRQTHGPTAGETALVQGRARRRHGHGTRPVGAFDADHSISSIPPTTAPPASSVRSKIVSA